MVKRDTEWGENVTFFDYSKFAELIVGECVRVVENEFFSDPHEVYQALELIKARFGVE